MSNNSLLIYNLPILFEILNEIKENFNFKIYNINKNYEISKIDKKKYKNFIILTNEKNQIKNIDKQLVIEKFPIEIFSLIKKINIFLLKQNYNFQSDIKIKDYKLNINSREILKNNIKLNLTEREIEIIMFLYNSKKSETVYNLQKQVWGYNSDLETHTVETHIYRLRKKIDEKFSDKKFILSSEKGYSL